MKELLEERYHTSFWGLSPGLIEQKLKAKPSEEAQQTMLELTLVLDWAKPFFEEARKRAQEAATNLLRNQ
jgi:hypothetical protein